MSLRIAVLAPVNSSNYNEGLLASIAPVVPPDVEVQVYNIDQGSPCIQNRLNLTENALAVVRLAQQLEQLFDARCGVNVVVDDHDPTPR